MASTRSRNSPAAMASRIRLARLGSWAVKSLASMAAESRPPGDVFMPEAKISLTLSRMHWAGAKVGSRWEVAWSRLSMALPIIDISAGGRSPWTAREPAQVDQHRPDLAGRRRWPPPRTTRWATSSRNAAAS